MDIKEMMLTTNSAEKGKGSFFLLHANHNRTRYQVFKKLKAGLITMCTCGTGKMRTYSTAALNIGGPEKTNMVNNTYISSRQAVWGHTPTQADHHTL